jgi:protein-tyrosine-phosphatase
VVGLADGAATVLLACVQNAGRSQIAAALFDRAADPAKARALGRHRSEAGFREALGPA